MSTRQLIACAVILALVCCGVMWLLEDFRQAKLIADFQHELSKLPTYMQGGENAAPGTGS